MHTQIIEVAADAIIAFEDNGQILLWNQGAERIFGFNSLEAIGQNVSIIVLEQDLEKYFNALTAPKYHTQNQIQGRTVEFYSAHKDGHKIPVEATLSSWEDDGTLYFAAVIRDISKRIAVEERNDRILQSQIAISTVLKIAMKPISLSEVLQEALETILFVPWLSTESKGAIFLLNDQETHLLLRASNGLQQRILTLCDNIKVGDCLCGLAALTRKIVYKSNVDTDHTVKIPGC